MCGVLVALIGKNSAALCHLQLPQHMKMLSLIGSQHRVKHPLYSSLRLGDTISNLLYCQTQHDYIHVFLGGAGHSDYIPACILPR